MMRDGRERGYERDRETERERGGGRESEREIRLAKQCIESEIWGCLFVNMLVSFTFCPQSRMLILLHYLHYIIFPLHYITLHYV